MALASGALLVGFADVKGLADLPRAVVVAMKHSPEVFADADDMPNPAYAREYADLNATLTDMGCRIADHLQQAGYHAVAQPATLHKIAPHTLAATQLAGVTVFSGCGGNASPVQGLVRPPEAGKPQAERSAR